MTIKQVKKNKKGFSIIEVVICIFIISVGLVGMVALINQSIQVEYINKNKLVASQLAQEGLEMIRNKRDNNGWQSSAHFYDGIANVGSAKKFALDVNGNITNVSSINDPAAALYICTSGATSGLVGCSSGTKTVFKRMITTTYDSVNKMIDVVCLIEWQEKSTAKQYIAESQLYDWFK